MLAKPWIKETLKTQGVEVKILMQVKFLRCGQRRLLKYLLSIAIECMGKQEIRYTRLGRSVSIPKISSCTPLDCNKQEFIHSVHISTVSDTYHVHFKSYFSSNSFGNKDQTFVASSLSFYTSRSWKYFTDTWASYQDFIKKKFGFTLQTCNPKYNFEGEISENCQFFIYCKRNQGYVLLILVLNLTRRARGFLF